MENGGWRATPTCSRELSGQPVLSRQTADPSEVPLVACNQRVAQGDRVCGDQEVIGGDGAAHFLQLGANKAAYAPVLAYALAYAKTAFKPTDCAAGTRMAVVPLPPREA